MAATDRLRSTVKPQRSSQSAMAKMEAQMMMVEAKPAGPGLCKWATLLRHLTRLLIRLKLRKQLETLQLMHLLPTPPRRLKRNFPL
jgi:hypothetical protein